MIKNQNHNCLTATASRRTATVLLRLIHADSIQEAFWLLLALLEGPDGQSSAIRRGYAMQTHICDICAMPCQCLVGALSRISLPIRLRSRGRGL